MVNAINENKKVLTDHEINIKDEITKKDITKVVNYINEGKWYFRDQFAPNCESPVENDLFKIILLPVIPFV